MRVRRLRRRARGAGALSHAAYLRWTSGGPAVYLARRTRSYTRIVLSVRASPLRARPGGRARGRLRKKRRPAAGYTKSTWQVNERSPEGISQVRQRSRTGAFVGAAKPANSLPRGAAMPDRHAPAAPARDCPDAP